MKNQKSTFQQSQTNKLRSELYSYYGVPTLNDYAELMYQKKCEGINNEVKFMASLLNKDEEKIVLDCLENLLYYQDMDCPLSPAKIARDFHLDINDDVYGYDPANYPDDFDPELYGIE